MIFVRHLHQARTYSTAAASATVIEFVVSAVVAHPATVVRVVIVVRYGVAIIGALAGTCVCTGLVLALSHHVGKAFQLAVARSTSMTASGHTVVVHHDVGTTVHANLIGRIIQCGRRASVDDLSVGRFSVNFIYIIDAVATELHDLVGRSIEEE